MSGPGRDSIGRRDLLRSSLAALTGVHAFGVFAGCRAASGPGDGTDWTIDDPFLSGNNAPVSTELIATELKVTGEIPRELDGVFLRNGPNQRFRPFAYQFPFDGDGMIHAVTFEDGHATYRNRWIRTRGFVEEEKAGRALYGSILGPGPYKNPANTSIVSHGDHVLALYEGGTPYELDGDLQTLGQWDYHGVIGGKMTAHPRIDPVSGEMHFFKYSLGETPYLTYYVASRVGEVVRQLPIDLPEPTLIHDTILTDQYMVFIHCPIAFVSGSATGFEWRDGSGARVGLINRVDLTQPPIWIETEPLFLWHFMNAYRSGDELVVDYVRHGRPSFALGRGPSTPPSFRRLRVDPVARVISHSTHDSRIAEYPTHDPRRTGLDYRYGYAAMITQFHRLPEYFDRVVQYDLLRGESRTHDYGSNRFSGEPIVVPNPTSSAEEDAFVMSYVFDEREHRSDLVILRASDFSGEPIAIVHLPVRVPNGLHGHWMAG